MTDSPVVSPSSARQFDIVARLRAMIIHLGLSGLVAALVAALVFCIWYPSPYREISGGRELFLLVVSVDIVLGPLITFSIFNRRKPLRELRRDLLIIAMLQLAGMAYGLNTLWDARPVYAVFELDRFVVVRAVDIDVDTLGSAPEDFRRLPVLGPSFIAAIPPTDAVEVSKSLDLELKGRNISVQPATWRPYETAAPLVLKRAQPLADLRRLYPDHAKEIDAVARSAGLSIERMAYLPILSREPGWVALLDNQNAKVRGYLPFGGF